MNPRTIVTEDVGSRINMRRLPPKYDPKPTQSEGETSDPLIADHRNFYKVEKWMKDGGASIPECFRPILGHRSINSTTRYAALAPKFCFKTFGARLVFAWMKPPNAPACGNPNQVQSAICLSLI